MDASFLQSYGDESVIDPIVSPAGSSRVSRGGSWLREASRARSAHRFNYSPTSGTFESGFRLALTCRSGVSSPAEHGLGAGSSGIGTEGVSAEQRP